MPTVKATIMKTYCLLGVMLLLTLTAGFTIGAGLQDGACGCQLHCPRCECCLPEVEIEKFKKHCWEVECVPVCIPQVTFPWEHAKHGHHGCGPLYCPPAKPAKTRNVHVLKEVEYECQRCRYKWKPVCCDDWAAEKQVEAEQGQAEEVEPPKPMPPAAREADDAPSPPPAPATAGRSAFLPLHRTGLHNPPDKSGSFWQSIFGR